MAADGTIKIDTSIDGKGFQTGLNSISTSAQSALGSFGSSAQKAGKSISDVGKALAPASVAIDAIGGASIKTAANFETSMAQTAGALNLPVDKIGSLRDLALQTGKDTIFSATEAGNAMTELAKGGLTEADIQGGALKSTMDLAASSGMDLGMAANTVVQSMGAFGLSADDSAQAVNALAGAAAASSTDVGPLSEALSQCAAQAHTAGWSIQDTTAILAEFADKGIVGSDAGTSLKTMLQRLAAPTGAAAKEMSALGINVWDSSGRMKDATGISDELQKHLSGLSDAQKQAALQTIFGSDATRAASILMDEGSKGLEKYTKATNDQASASRLADSQMGKADKTIEQMKGSLETASIQIGTSLAPSVQKAAEFIGNLADSFSSLPSGVQSAIIGISAFIGLTTPLIIGTGSAINSIGTLATTFGNIGPFIEKVKVAFTSFFSILAANPIILIVAAIAALVAGIVVLWNTNEGFRDAVMSIWGAIVGFFTDTIPSAWNGLMELFNGIPDWWNGIWTRVGQFFTDCWNGIISFFTDTVPAWIASVGEWFQQLPYNIGLALGTAAKAVVDFGTNIWNWVTTELPKIIQGIINWFAQLPGKIWAFLVQVVANIGTWGTNMWNYLSVQIPKIINGIGAWFSQLPGKIWGFLTTVISNIGTWGKDMLQKAGQAAKDTATNVVNGFKALPQNMLNIGKNIVTGLWNGIKSSAKWLWDKITGFCDDIVDGFKKGFGIHSPSKLMSNEIGRFLPPGITVGMDKAMPSTIRDMKSQLADMMAQARATIAAERARFGTTFAARSNYQVALAGGYGTASMPAEPYTGPDTVEAHISINDREFAVATAPAIGKQLGWKGGK